ncbi:ParB/RepB/Spo0J family partition protein [Candidatus Nephthysia bennettiae]|uniref:ParB/RepB/Spo0J family partition protein n=1 Tax=Candidatus Nephthysia bennettiae TaxID=3127016 RepID=A0A934K637_9BACT|nr:ParB/RepB/Spo0J family partition protein [Candidatus Dormibacteraeota bacterium]
MTTATRSIEEVALDSIRDHPRNLRREIGDVGELAESMKTFGVLEPIVLAPALDAEGGVVLIAGHRRRAAARKAGLSTIPAEVRQDLNSETKQMLAMLVENGRRRDLSPIEEAHGYQQVLDLGEFTAAKIGKAIGVPTARIKGRVALTSLPEAVQEKIHAAQITLGEAEALAEFADDATAMKRLLRDVGSYNFKFTVEQERRARERTATVTQARRDFEKAGVRVIERPDGFHWSSQEKPVQSFIDPQAEAVDGQPVRFTPLSHGAACPHHAVIVDTFNGEPIHVCTDPAAAGHQPFRQGPVTAAEEDRDPEAAWAAERQRQDQREEALIVASRVRRSFAEGLIRPSGAKTADSLLRLVVRESLIAVLDESDLDQLRALGELVGVTVSQEIEEWEPVLEAFTQAAEGKRSIHDLIGVLFALRLLDYEARGRQEYQWQADDGFRHYVLLLIELGYQPSDIERELLSTWAGGEESAEDQDGEATASEHQDDGIEEPAVTS